MIQISNKNNTGYLYKLDFPNGKSYIGVTKREPQVRFCQHVRMARKNNAKAVHHAINKYGKDSVMLNTLAIGSMDYLYELEVSAIRSFGTLYPKGYNLTIGGDGAKGLDEATRVKMGAKNKGRVISDEARKRISEARKMAAPPTPEARFKMGSSFRGKKLSEEHKEKIRQSNLNKIRTPDHCRKLSAARMGKGISNANKEALKKANTGRIKSPEELAKISAKVRAAWVRKKSFLNHQHTTENEYYVAQGMQQNQPNQTETA